MAYDSQKHHRRSLRLKGYDYSQAGAYFVTICTEDRTCLFGDVAGGQMHLNDAGRIILSQWEALPVRFSGVELDVFGVMPNHLHGILVLATTAESAAPPVLGEIVGAFKSLTTDLYIKGVKQSGWLPFRGRLWQRNFHEHIIRNEKTLQRIRQYIVDNPIHWEIDPENPQVERAKGPGLRPFLPPDPPL
jgi:REP element-mobilizing transposase RayT